MQRQSIPITDWVTEQLASFGKIAVAGSGVSAEPKSPKRKPAPWWGGAMMLQQGPQTPGVPAVTPTVPTPVVAPVAAPAAPAVPAAPPVYPTVQPAMAPVLVPAVAQQPQQGGFSLSSLSDSAAKAMAQATAVPRALAYRRQPHVVEALAWQTAAQDGQQVLGGAADTDVDYDRYTVQDSAGKWSFDFEKFRSDTDARIVEFQETRKALTAAGITEPEELSEFLAATKDVSDTFGEVFGLGATQTFVKQVMTDGKLDPVKLAFMKDEIIPGFQKLKSSLQSAIGNRFREDSQTGEWSSQPRDLGPTLKKLSRLGVNPQSYINSETKEVDFKQLDQDLDLINGFATELNRLEMLDDVIGLVPGDGERLQASGTMQALLEVVFLMLGPKMLNLMVGIHKQY